VDDRGIEVIGPIAGVTFVVLDVLAGFLYPQAPPSDSSPAVLLSWVHGHRIAIQAGMILGLFASAIFLWFVGHLKNCLTDSVAGLRSLAPMVFGAGVAFALANAIGTVPNALLAFMDSQRQGLSDPTVLRLLADLNTVLFSLDTVISVIFMFALGLALLRGDLHAPRWLGWLCLLVAVVNVVATWLAVTFSTYHGKGWNALGFGSFIGFLVIVLILSIALLRRPTRRVTPAP
jgi:hypothetical protein